MSIEKNDYDAKNRENFSFFPFAQKIISKFGKKAQTSLQKRVRYLTIKMGIAYSDSHLKIQ